MITRTLDEILADYRSSLAAVQSEEMKRAEIKNSPEYKNLEYNELKLQEQRIAMLKALPDTSEEHAMDRKELMEYMQKNQEFRAGEFVAKTRVVRRVDTRQVLEAMQGDLDNLMIVADVKISALEKFSKENPEYKRDLRKCIIEEGYTVTDVLFQEAK